MADSPYSARTAGGALPTRLVPPDFSIAPPTRVVGTGLATASLVLGILAVVLNVLLLPTVLSIVFGAISLAKGTTARTRSIVGIVLGVVGILAVAVQAAIAIPVFLALQVDARDAQVRSALANDKTALVGYAVDHDGRLPQPVVPAELVQYGWDAPGSVSRLDYTAGRGDQAGAFCLVATAASGHRFVVTTRTPVVRADSCPTVW